MDKLNILIWIHLCTVIPAALIGTWLITAPKGTPLHRLLGRWYMGLMAFTACLTLLLPAEVGPVFFGHFGPLHLLSILTAWTVPTAWHAARTGQIRKHKSAMIQLYIGGILLAGTFAVMGEGRILHTLLFR